MHLLLKSFFYILALAGALISLSACQKEAPKTVTWQLQSQATANSTDFKQLREMTDNIRMMSGGRFDITPLAGGRLTNGPDIFHAVKEGRVAMGNGWPNWWSGQHPAWAVVASGPFDFMNLDASMMFFIAGEGTSLANELSLSEGIIWRPAWWSGMEFGLLSREEIKGIDDLSQKKIRVGPGLPGQLLASAGAYSIPLVPQEIRPAFEAKELDAVEWTTTSGAWELGLQDVAHYAITPAIWQPSVLSDFLINEKAYAALPVDLKIILETAMQAFTLNMTLKNKVNDLAALKKFYNQGTVINSWSADDISRWRVESDKLYRQHQKDHPFSDRLIKTKRAFKQTYDDYYQRFGPYE